MAELSITQSICAISTKCEGGLQLLGNDALNQLETTTTMVMVWRNG